MVHVGPKMEERNRERESEQETKSKKKKAMCTYTSQNTYPRRPVNEKVFQIHMQQNRRDPGSQSSNRMPPISLAKVLFADNMYDNDGYGIEIAFICLYLLLLWLVNHAFVIYFIGGI